MNNEEKEIFVSNIENSGMFSLLTEVFKATADSHGKMLEHNNSLRNRFIETAEKHEDRYLESNRPVIFFGLKETQAVRDEAFLYGQTRAFEIFSSSFMLEDHVTSRFAELSGKVSEVFLKALHFFFKKKREK